MAAAQPGSAIAATLTERMSAVTELANRFRIWLPNTFDICGSDDALAVCGKTPPIPTLRNEKNQNQWHQESIIHPHPVPRINLASRWGPKTFFRRLLECVPV